MIPVHFHARWSLYEQKFILTFAFKETEWEEKEFKLTPGEFVDLIKEANAQLVDTTDATLVYTIDVYDWKYNFQGGRGAFTALVEYYQKVYDSWVEYMTSR